jgi:hypothetical protein
VQGVHRGQNNVPDGLTGQQAHSAKDKPHQQQR